jgi:hypothetical protein
MKSCLMVNKGKGKEPDSGISSKRTNEIFCGIRKYSDILVYDYDDRRFVANGAAEGESAARSGLEESL